MLVSCVTAVSAQSAFPLLSARLGRRAFATSLWTVYFSSAGVYAMHPAVCSKLFGDKLGEARNATPARQT